jgi:uncharacterized membrane protein
MTNHQLTTLIVVALVASLQSCNSREKEDAAARTEVPQEPVRLRVLYIEGFPRWEYRALTEMMRSDPSLEYQAYLLNAADGYEQRSSAGLPPLTHVPRTIEDLIGYDVVVIGDIPTSFMAASDVLGTCIGEFLRIHGGGLVAIAGSNCSSLPASVRQHLPVQVDDSTMRTVENGYAIKVTHAGHASSMLRGGKWTEPTRSFYSYLDGVSAKPASSILAVYQRQDSSGDDAPVVVIADVGKGRSLFWGFDDLWRVHSWDPQAYRQIWTQALRHVAAGRPRVKGG